MQLLVSAAETKQFFMGAGFHDMPLVENNDHVCVLNGAQTVCDGEHGTVCHDFIQRILHQFLRDGVKRTGGFVKNQDRRILEDCAGNGNTLFLSAAQQEPFSPTMVS